MECTICFEKYTNTKRQRIECPHCEFTVCKICAKKHLCSIIDPSCMECKKRWIYKYLVKTFGHNFVNSTLKKNRGDILLQYEKSLIPDNMHEYEIYKSRKDLSIHGSMVKKYIQQIIESDVVDYKIIDELNYSKFRIRNIKSFLDELENETQYKSKFIMPCPVTDCRGMLSTKWKCVICNIYVCKDCRAPKGMTHNTEHICNEEDSLSVKMIAKDSKPCPKCSSLIHRYQGCPQMWCTLCKTAFDWNTGKIITGPIHNPHYMDFFRENPDHAQEEEIIINGCQLTSINKIHRAKISNIYKNRLTLLRQFIIHLSEVVLPSLRNDLTQDINKDLRHKYLDSVISEEQWKKSLSMRDTKRSINTELYEVVELFVHVSEGYLERFTTETKKISQLLGELMKLIEYVNVLFEDVGKCYKRKYPIITIDNNCNLTYE